MDQGALIEGDKRYTLLRWWGADAPPLDWCVAWIGLNPSTADAREDDPTMRRNRRFTREKTDAHGFVMLNLWALRKPRPPVLQQALCVGCTHDAEAPPPHPLYRPASDGLAVWRPRSRGACLRPPTESPDHEGRG